jgi:hypothetical protein
MPSQFLIQTGFAALICIAIGAKALESVLRTWIGQVFCTRRLKKALENSSPNQRPGIILACSQLEGRAVGSPDGDNTDDVLQVRPPTPPIPRNKRRRKRRRD